LDLVVTALVGFGGVIVGAALTGLIDLWRQLLDGRAAARIVRLEIQANVNRAVQSIDVGRADFRLADDAWKDLRVKLAPLVPDVVLNHISVGYVGIFIVEDWIRRLNQKPEEARANVRQWSEQMIIDSSFLIQLERRSRAAQMLDLLLGRPTFPTPNSGESRVEDELEEHKKKIFKQFEGDPQ